MRQTVMCPNCVSPNAASQQFCTTCGTKLAPGGQQQAWQLQPTSVVPQSTIGADEVDSVQQTVTCPNCGSPNAASQQFCTSCGAKLSLGGPQAKQAPDATVLTKEEATLPQRTRRYTILGVSALIFRIMGWVILVGGILGSIILAVMAALGSMANLVDLLDQGFSFIGISGVAGAGLAVMVFGGIIGSLLWGLGLLAFADLCKAIIVIDENTRLED